MPEYLNCWYSFLFPQQCPALPNFDLELLDYILIPFNVWSDGLKRIRKMLLSSPNTQKLIPEDNHFLAYSFHRLCNGRNSILYRIHQLLNQRFQLPQQNIVRLNLPVQFTAVRNDPFLLQRTGDHPS